MNTKKKILIVTGILIFAFLITNVGLPLRYNSIYAKIDIRSNNAKIFIIEKPFLHKKELNSLTKEYGFEYALISDYNKLSDLQQKGMIKYNAIIENYLESINREDWKNKLESKIDSIERTKIPALY